MMAMCHFQQPDRPRYLESFCHGERDSSYPPIQPRCVVLVGGQELRDDDDGVVVLMGTSI